jgi:purine-binding chemotaxis protein CheW
VLDVDRFLSEVGARLPQPERAPVASVEQMRVVTFLLGHKRYALGIEYITEISREPRLTPVPGLPPWVLGVTNLHGDILSIVDLPRFLEIPSSPTKLTLMVAQAADQKIGLAVDDIGFIFSFPPDQIISPPFEIPPEVVHCLRGVVDYQQEFVRLLDCERLLLGPHMQQFF